MPAFLTLRQLLAGFEKPSAIQQRGIVPFCRGYDVIQQAQSDAATLVKERAEWALERQDFSARHYEIQAALETEQQRGAALLADRQDARERAGAVVSNQSFT